MKKFIIRNDDVNFDTTLSEIKQFCEICDKYGYQIIQAITLMGECKKIDVKMSNEEIRRLSSEVFNDNKEVLKYLQSRNDLIAVHGYWHTHEPSENEIEIAKDILEVLGLKPTYFVPPFNEGEYSDETCGLKVCKLSLKKGERLEDFLDKGTPIADIMYLHSWRFDNNWYTFEKLDKCLDRIKNISKEIL